MEFNSIEVLQPNKTRQAVEPFNAIESVRRAKLTQALAEETKRQGCNLVVYIQVNISNKHQKSGFLRADAPPRIEACHNVDHGISTPSLDMPLDFSQPITHGITHFQAGRTTFGASPWGPQ
ncbi:hypothetical protein VK98_17430 [Chromobacterium sp. LK11]|nr:hypothetical protein VK98_17430 [Chromobacterium sp. LK11]